MNLFSIITVTYDDFENFKNTFESVKSQTFSEYEWVVINGRKNDDTDEYVKKIGLNNLFYLAEKDEGLYDAMNKGIYNSKGKYLIFLNSGDVFSNKGILQEISNLINSSNTSPDFIYGDSNEINSKGDLFYRKSRNLWRKSIGMFTHHQTMFYRRDILMNNKGMLELQYQTLYEF